MSFWKKVVFVAWLVPFAWQACESDLLRAQEPSSSPDQGIPQSHPSLDEAILIDDWLGTWQGLMNFQSAEGRSYSIQVILAITKLDDPNRLKWTLSYDGPPGKEVQEYELLRKSERPTHLAFLEKSGIETQATVFDNAILSQYTIGNQVILRKYEIQNSDPSEMHFELVTSPAASNVPSGGKDNAPEVTSLQPWSRRIARLKRVEPQPQSPSHSLAFLTKWKKLSTEVYDNKQDDIFFIDERVGWYANGAGKIFKTTDGGENWTLQCNTPGTFFRCLAFIDHQHGFAGNVGLDRFPGVTDTNPLYETKDGGQTWNTVTTIEGKPIEGLCAIQVLRDKHVSHGELIARTRLIGVGRVGGPAAMIISDDLGATWQQIDISSHAAMAFDVHFLDRNVGFIAAATDADFAKCNALILRTEDGGKTWQKAYQSSRPYELTWKLAFPSRDTGYVTIQSYNPDPSASARFVAKSQDGGKTWSELPLVKNHAVRQFGIAFLDNETGWIGAVPNGFFTNNGGQTWRRASIGNAVNRIRLQSTENKTLGFAIGTEVHRIEIPKVE